MRRAKSLSIIILIVMLAGCASTGAKTPAGADSDFVGNNYKVLYAEATAVDAAMTTMGTMYKAKQFSEANRTSAETAFNQFKAAFDDAVNKLVAYSTVPTDAAKTAANNACIKVQTTAALVTALNIIQATGGK